MRLQVFVDDNAPFEMNIGEPGPKHTFKWLSLVACQRNVEARRNVSFGLRSPGPVKIPSRVDIVRGGLTAPFGVKPDCLLSDLLPEGGNVYVTTVGKPILDECASPVATPWQDEAFLHSPIAQYRKQTRADTWAAAVDPESRNKSGGVLKTLALRPVDIMPAIGDAELFAADFIKMESALLLTSMDERPAFRGLIWRHYKDIRTVWLQYATVVEELDARKSVISFSNWMDCFADCRVMDSRSYHKIDWKRVFLRSILGSRFVPIDASWIDNNNENPNPRFRIRETDHLSFHHFIDTLCLAFACVGAFQHAHPSRSDETPTAVMIGDSLFTSVAALEAAFTRTIGVRARCINSDDPIKLAVHNPRISFCFHNDRASIRDIFRKHASQIDEEEPVQREFGRRVPMKKAVAVDRFQPLYMTVSQFQGVLLEAGLAELPAPVSAEPSGTVDASGSSLTILTSFSKPDLHMDAFSPVVVPNSPGTLLQNLSRALSISGSRMGSRRTSLAGDEVIPVSPEPSMSESPGVATVSAYSPHSSVQFSKTVPARRLSPASSRLEAGKSSKPMSASTRSKSKRAFATVKTMVRLTRAAKVAVEITPVVPVDAGSAAKRPILSMASKHQSRRHKRTYEPLTLLAVSEIFRLSMMHPPEVLSTSGPSSRHAASRIGARKDESVLTLAEFKEALLRTAVAYCGDKHSDLQETLKTALGILIVKYRMDAL